MTDTLVQLLIVAYAAAVGLVVAGLTVSLYQMVTNQTAGFELFGRGIGALAASFAFFAVTGPILLLRETRPSAEGSAAPGILLFRITMMVMWSCCSGILVLDLLLSVGEMLG